MLDPTQWGTGAALIGALVALVSAWVAVVNVSRQLDTQKDLHATLLAHQHEQDERRWEREQTVRYGVQRIEAYSDFSRASDSLAYMASRALEGSPTINPGGRTYDQLVEQFFHASALIDLLAPDSVREAAMAVQQVVMTLTSEDGTERSLAEYEKIYDSLRPLRDTFMTLCRTEGVTTMPYRDAAGSPVPLTPDNGRGG